jgi:PAS domain S-box-containing protein
MCAWSENEVQTQLSFETLLAEISARFINLPADQIDTQIDAALRVVCQSLDVDESTIYLREMENPDIFVLSYVLRDPALPPPPKTKFTAAENFPWCNQKLIANEIICVPDTQAAPPEAAVDKASWKKYDVCSALVIPLSTGGGRPVGFWGIDSTSGKRDWPEPLQRRLKIIADVFANALERAVYERNLRESEARLRLAADTAGAGFWTIDVTTGTVWATPKLKELFGLKPDDSVDIEKFFNIIHPDHREPMRQAIDSMLRGEEAVLEYRLLPCDGSIRWVMSRGKRHRHSLQKPSLLMGITFDVTERRAAEEALRTVSGRLIQAQEQERKRIARELHDNISQRLAMIAIGVQQIRSKDPASTERQREALGKLLMDIKEAGSEIHTLSHELHSPKLDYLGLVPAIRGFCRELSDSQQVEIRFSEPDLPISFPPDLALALFRIAQESLHNALKYSGVRTFEVALRTVENEIELTISDQGIGFDVGSALKGEGLGLVSMRERLLPLQGALSIQSQPHRGTEIKVRVPLNTAPPCGMT